MKDLKICSFFGHRDVTVTEELCVLATKEILCAIEFVYVTPYISLSEQANDVTAEPSMRLPSANEKAEKSG